MCLTVGGETVVDLWGGIADPKTQAPWTHDTVGIVFSCTKGATAICAHMLASRGIDAGRLQVVSYGEERPKHDNDREETRRLNRRAALVVRLQ